MNSTPPAAEPVEIRKVTLAHCGELQISKNELKGWFHPIPLTLWQCIIGFHRKISIDHGAESVSYHRWYEPEKRYHTIIPYQVTHARGLSVNTPWSDARNVELLDEYGRLYNESFFPACTIHTHVNIPAFESGTDAKDEEDYAGWHITLGKLLTHMEYDIDCRMRLPKIPYVREMQNPDVPYQLKWENIFPIGTNKEAVLTIPGSEDWLHLVNRVKVL